MDLVALITRAVYQRGLNVVSHRSGSESGQVLTVLWLAPRCGDVRLSGA